MERSIDRFYLHLLSMSNLNKSNTQRKKSRSFSQKRPTIDFCKFLYKEVGRDFFGETDFKWSNQDWLDYTSNDFFKLYIFKTK
jgi:hypothetical protein